MENQDILGTQVGTKAKPKLVAKPVQVQGLAVEEVGEKKNKILAIICKHPDSEKTMRMTKMRVMIGETLKIVGLWVNLDGDGLIQKESTLDDLMKLANVKTLAELEGKMLETVEDKKTGFIVLKGNY